MDENNKSTFRKWWEETSWGQKVLWPGMFITGLAAILNFWIAWDLPIPASIQFVNGKIKTEVHPVKPVLRDIQIELAEGKLAQIEELIFKWNKELVENRGDSGLLRTRIHELERTKKALEQQLVTLNRIKDN